MSGEGGRERWWLAALRWLLTLVGGVLIGAGLVLHGQVALAHFMRAEVDATFFLWRAVGEATIFLQGSDVRMAFALKEVPDEVLRESDHAAWALVVVGAMFALTAPLLPRRRGRRGSPGPVRKPAAAR